MPHPIPRLAFENVDPELQKLLKPTVERLGYFGEMAQAMANLPKAHQAFMQYTAAVKEPLPFNLNEVCALTVCSLLGADYERIQHERLSLKTGMDRAWIGELTGVEPPETSQLDDAEAKVRDLAVAVVERSGRNCESELAAVAEAIGPEQALAVLFQVTRFMTISALVHALDVTLPMPSIFDETAGES